MSRTTLVAALATTAPLASTATAVAEPENPAWVATSTSTPYQVTPPTAPEVFPQARTAAADDVTASDFKTECQGRSEARTMFGCAESRFEQCFAGHRKVELKVSPGAPTTIASVEFDYTVLAFAYDGDRRVDYTVLLDNYRTSAARSATSPNSSSVSAGAAPPRT